MLGRLAPILVLFPLVGFPALAQQRDASIPHAQDRPPGPALSPVEAIAKMTVPPGFSVELVASEPEVVNPVAMTIDERGRFWITESLEYPRKSAGAGRDRVKILEDTDGDGKADKFTVFADGLNIPSGIAVGGGGVWVANSPDFLFFKDTDGDGKADTKEVVAHRLRPRRHARAAELADLGSRRLPLRLERRLQPGPDRLSRQALRIHLRRVPDRPQGPATSRSSARGPATPGGSPGNENGSMPSPAPASSTTSGT